MGYALRPQCMHKLLTISNNFGASRCAERTCHMSIVCEPSGMKVRCWPIEWDEKHKHPGCLWCVNSKQEVVTLNTAQREMRDLKHPSDLHFVFLLCFSHLLRSMDPDVCSCVSVGSSWPLLADARQREPHQQVSLTIRDQLPRRKTHPTCVAYSLESTALAINPCKVYKGIIFPPTTLLLPSSTLSLDSTWVGGMGQKCFSGSVLMHRRFTSGVLRSQRCGQGKACA